MFINTGKSSNTDIKTNIRDVGNIEYCHRYIIIELPSKPGTFQSSITVINISSAMRDGNVGIMKSHNVSRNTNVYHCFGSVWKRLPAHSRVDNIQQYFDIDSVLVVDDMSYGAHDYDLSRRKFDELRSTSSYHDMHSNPKKFSEAPNIRFYNQEHHVMNQDMSSDEYLTGETFMKNMVERSKLNLETVRLRDLIDDYTTILVSNPANFTNVLENPLDCTDEEMQRISIHVVGPVTDILLNMMFTEMVFQYDSVEGMSGIQYKTRHKMPEAFYTEQVLGNTMDVFEASMEYVSDIVTSEFRLFVKAQVNSLHLRFIMYDSTGRSSSITKHLEYDIGKFRNTQHYDSIVINHGDDTL